MIKSSRQEFQHNNSYNSNNITIIISQHIENPDIVRTVYSGIFTSGLFWDIQQYSAIVRHIEAYLGIIEAYRALIKNIRNST